MKVLVTRPETSSRRLVEKLAALGYDTVTNSMLDIVPVEFQVELADFTVLLFTSKSAVERLQPSDLKSFSGTVYAVGESTGRVLQDKGVNQVRVAGGDSARMVEEICAQVPPAGERLLHVSGKEVRLDLVQALSAHGYDIERVITYDARPATALNPEVVRDIHLHQIDYALFYSPRSATTFIELACAENIEADLSSITAIAISPQVKVALENATWKQTLAAERALEADVLVALQEATAEYGE